jgi:hypothetical protein
MGVPNMRLGVVEPPLGAGGVGGWGRRRWSAVVPGVGVAQFQAKIKKSGILAPGNE